VQSPVKDLMPRNAGTVSNCVENFSCDKTWMKTEVVCIAAWTTAVLERFGWLVNDDWHKTALVLWYILVLDANS
jgi:hypothetical protein